MHGGESSELGSRLRGQLDRRSEFVAQVCRDRREDFEETRWGLARSARGLVIGESSGQLRSNFGTGGSSGAGSSERAPPEVVEGRGAQTIVHLDDSELDAGRSGSSNVAPSRGSGVLASA